MGTPNPKELGTRKIKTPLQCIVAGFLVTPTGLATLRVPLPGRRHGKVLQKALQPSAAYGFYYVIPYVSKLPTGWHKKASQLRCGAFFELCSGDSYRIQNGL